MKYLRKYNESEDFARVSGQEENDLDFILAKIKEKYPIDAVRDMYKEECGQWSDKYEEEASFSGAAEEVVLNTLIGWFQKQYSKTLSDETFDEAYSKLQDVYEFLKH